METPGKVTVGHLKRNAYLYIRQSTFHQVLQNIESTARQYDLRRRAIALGWAEADIVVVDQDQGQSGAAATDRSGFQTLVTEVGLGRAGIVMGLEVSRLARNCADWHRLLEICALSETLILDEDGLYDPTHFNDRLLLGLKGTMSEAELHVLRARLRGGLLNKARRGELEMALPVGFVPDGKGLAMLDPDQQVQHAVRLFFQTYARVGSARGVASHFRKEGLLFPKRPRSGPEKGELLWRPLTESRAYQVLRNPRYAGAFAFGKTRQRHGLRRVLEHLPREQWFALQLQAHPGYLTWPEYEANQRRIADHAKALGVDRRRAPPREGPALLQGLALCGRCGLGMSVRYHHRRGRLSPDYVCEGVGHHHGEPACQAISGGGIDQAIGELLLAMVTPAAIEVALAVQQDLQARLQEADHLRQQQVERAAYEAELARRRYLKVDPDNRLVAGSLEAEWNQALRVHSEVQQEYQRRRQSDRAMLDENTRARVLSLATDFPALWNDPATADRDRKRMVKLLIEDVTLVKTSEHIEVRVRFKGGTTKSLTLHKPLNAFHERKHDSAVVAAIDRLLDDHTNAEIAAQLNAQGLCSGCGRPFDGHRVKVIQRAYHLKHRFDRLRDRGLLTLDEAAEHLAMPPWKVKKLRGRGQLPLRAHRLDDAGQHMYELVDGAKPLPAPIPSARSKEVQCEA